METSELYLNGLSTSLPPDVQRRFLARVPGLEQARMTQPGYAMEYDYYSPKRLEATPSLKLLNGLYLAGRVNGTTGYEEAAQVDFVGLVSFRCGPGGGRVRAGCAHPRGEGAQEAGSALRAPGWLLKPWDVSRETHGNSLRPGATSRPADVRPTAGRVAAGQRDTLVTSWHTIACPAFPPLVEGVCFT